jgi:hypothetical protein
VTIPSQNIRKPVTINTNQSLHKSITTTLLLFIKADLASNLVIASKQFSQKKENTIRTMTDKLIPKDPSKVMVIRQVSPAITTLSVPFLRFGRFKIGGRGTIGKWSALLILNFKVLT